MIEIDLAGSLEEPTDGPGCGRAIGYVFEDFNLLTGLTAAENASLPLELEGTSAKAARVAALAALERLGIPTVPTGSPTSSPAASGSGWPSPAP